MLSVAAEERGEREWQFLRLLVRGEHESAVGMGDDLIEVLAEAKTFLGQAPGTTSDPAEPGHAGDGFQRPLVPRSRFQPRLTRSVRRVERASTQKGGTRLCVRESRARHICSG
jgi:hypothetical protein